MSSFPSQKIAALVKDEKWDEFREEVKKWILENPTEGTGKPSLLEALHAYVKISNQVDEKYLKEMQEIKETLKTLANTEKAIDDVDRSNKIQNKIKDL
jgi:hypothetical protein